MQLEMIPLLRRDFGLPTLLIEHQKLGEFPGSLKEVASDATRLEKTHFDMLHEPSIAQYVENSEREHYVLAGAETHVCIFQSALKLQERGKTVFVLANTCSTRYQVDHDVALARLRNNGVELLTREMFFFELIGRSDHPKYLDLARKYLDGRYIR